MGELICPSGSTQGNGRKALEDCEPSRDFAHVLTARRELPASTLKFHFSPRHAQYHQSQVRSVWVGVGDTAGGDEPWWNSTGDCRDWRDFPEEPGVGPAVPLAELSTGKEPSSSVSRKEATGADTARRRVTAGDESLLPNFHISQESPCFQCP